MTGLTAPAPLSPNAAMRWSVVEVLLRGQAPATILEIGCGQGGFGSRLARRGAYLGVEPDSTSWNTARQRIEPLGGEVRNVAWSDIEAGRTFDLVCAFEVLEHLHDDGAALRAWRELVAPGGSVLVSMPAWQKRFGAWDLRVGHQRRYEPDPTAGLLVASGFADPKVVVYGWPLGYMLEAGRVRIATRLTISADDLSMPARTASSGRLLQPPSWIGRVADLGMRPFLALQWRQPGRGTGLVAIARRPLSVR